MLTYHSVQACRKKSYVVTLFEAHYPPPSLPITGFQEMVEDCPGRYCGRVFNNDPNGSCYSECEVGNLYMLFFRQRQAAEVGQKGLVPRDQLL